MTTTAGAVPPALRARLSVADAPAAFREAAGPPVDVGAGVTLPLSWPAVDGATDAEVTSCAALLTPLLVEEDRGDHSVGRDPGHDPDADHSHVVTMSGPTRVRRLVLRGLVRRDGQSTRAVESERDLPGGVRLAVGVATGGDFGPPLHTVPALAGGELQPPPLAGASLTPAPGAALLRLPDVPATRVRISLVTGEAPQSFDLQWSRLTSVGVVAAVPPADLAVTAADGATVWQSPGEVLPGPGPLVVDLRAAAQAALSTAVAAGAPPSVTFRLTGRRGSHVLLRSPVARGALLRGFPGVQRTAVPGQPVALSGVRGLAAEAPSAAVADLTVRYDGLRVLPAPFSDPVPGPRASVSGPVVRAGGRAALRLLPPAGHGRCPLARVALVGRASEDASLTVALVVLRPDGTEGEPVADPGVVAVPAGPVLGLVWVQLPAPVASPGVPTALSVRASAGTFLWAAAADGTPLVRLVVRDDDPEPDLLTLDGAPLTVVGAAGVHLPAAELPAAPFRGATPVLECPLLVTADLSDLLLRYAR